MNRLSQCESLWEWRWRWTKRMFVASAAFDLVALAFTLARVLC